MGLLDQVTVAPRAKTLTQLKNWVKTLDNAPTTNDINYLVEGGETKFTAAEVAAFRVDPGGMTREQVMERGGLTGLKDADGKPILNIDFRTKDGLAIWNSIAGADGLLSARERIQTLVQFDNTTEAGTAGKYNLTQAEATAGFEKLLTDAKADPKGIAKSYLALNKVGEDLKVDENDNDFKEIDSEVTIATKIAGGDFWGTVDPTPPSTPTAPAGTLAAILGIK
jgi:hypothetical protein